MRERRKEGHKVMYSVCIYMYMCVIDKESMYMYIHVYMYKNIMCTEVCKSDTSLHMQCRLCTELHVRRM